MITLTINKADAQDLLKELENVLDYIRDPEGYDLYDGIEIGRFADYLKEQIDEPHKESISHWGLFDTKHGISMTRKHYNAFAKIMSKTFKKVSTDSAYDTWNDIVNEMADLFERDNPNFKRKLFIDACKRV